MKGSYAGMHRKHEVHRGAYGITQKSWNINAPLIGVLGTCFRGNRYQQIGDSIPFYEAPQLAATSAAPLLEMKQPCNWVRQSGSVTPKV